MAETTQVASSRETDLPVRKGSQGHAWGISSPPVLFSNLSQLEEQAHLQKTKNQNPNQTTKS